MVWKDHVWPQANTPLHSQGVQLQHILTSLSTQVQLASLLLALVPLCKQQQQSCNIPPWSEWVRQWKPFSARSELCPCGRHAESPLGLNSTPVRFANPVQWNTCKILVPLLLCKTFLSTHGSHWQPSWFSVWATCYPPPSLPPQKRYSSGSYPRPCLASPVLVSHSCTDLRLP